MTRGCLFSSTSTVIGVLLTDFARIRWRCACAAESCSSCRVLTPWVGFPLLSPAEFLHRLQVPHLPTVMTAGPPKPTGGGLVVPLPTPPTAIIVSQSCICLSDSAANSLHLPGFAALLSSSLQLQPCSQAPGLV